MDNQDRQENIDNERQDLTILKSAIELDEENTNLRKALIK